MIDFKDKDIQDRYHVDLPYCRISFYKDHNWCCGGEDWTHVEITSHKSRYSGGKFSRDQSYLRDRVIGLLADAYEAGQKNKEAQIRQVLGIPRYL